MADNKAQWQDATLEILSKLDIAAEYRALGLDVCGDRPNAKGWMEARAFGVEDKTPSAGINVGGDPRFLGRYKDFRDGTSSTLFGFAAEKAGRFGGQWQEARNHYARKTGVKLPDGHDELAADKLDLTTLTYAVYSHYSSGKAGVTIRAMQEVGCMGARWPKKLSAERANHLIAVPMYGEHLLELDPTAWHVCPQNPRGRIRKFKGAGNPEEMVDKLTFGEPGLANVDGIRRLPDAEVVNIVEGLTDMLACQAVIGPWRDVDPEQRKDVVLTSGACTYHPKAEWAPHFAGKDVRLWFDVGDGKNEGQLAAQVWIKFLLPIANSVRNVKLPLGENGGKNDLRAWLVAGHNYNDMCEYAMSFPAIEPTDPEAGMLPRQALLKNLGLMVIGEHERSNTVEVFCEHTKKPRTIRDLNKMSMIELQQYCGEVADQFVHDGREAQNGKVQLKEVKSAIAIEACDKVFHHDELFGGGIWDVEGQIILVKHREVGFLCDGRIERSSMPFYNGRILDTTPSAGEWIDFVVLNRHLIEAQHDDWCRKVVEDAIKLFAQWNWKQDYAPEVIVGLIMATWLQTMWVHRPEVFVTGATVTGKTTLIDDCIAKGIFGAHAMFVQKVTEAAITQHMRHHGRVLIIDEFEKDVNRQKILELFRIASRGAGGEKLRGTADHRGAKFRLRHIPWFAAIEMGLKRGADRNRYIILELDAIPQHRRGKFQPPPTEWLADLGLKLLAVSLRHYPEAKRIFKHLQSFPYEGIQSRISDSFGVVVASLAAVRGYEDGKSHKLLTDILADWDFGLQQVQDNVELLGSILTAEIRGETGRLGSVTSFLEANDPETDEALARVGVRKINKRAASNGEIAKVLWICCDVVERQLLKNTDFLGQTIEQHLLRFPGAKRSKQRLGGHAFWGVEIPLKEVDEHFNKEEGDVAIPDYTQDGESGSHLEF